MKKKKKESHPFNPHKAALLPLNKFHIITSAGCLLCRHKRDKFSLLECRSGDRSESGTRDGGTSVEKQQQQQSSSS